MSTWTDEYQSSYDALTCELVTDDQAMEEAHVRVTVADLDEMWQRITSAGFDNVDEYVGYMISLEEGEVPDYTRDNDYIGAGAALELVDYPLPF